MDEYNRYGEYLLGNSLKIESDIFRYPIFKEARALEEEHDVFINSPPVVEDGVIVCPKCRGSKTISYQRQTRSVDEGMSTYSQCVDCKHRWKHNN